MRVITLIASIFVVVSVISLAYVSAQVEIGNSPSDISGVVIPAPPASTFNNNTAAVNTSDFWDNLDTPADINLGDLGGFSGEIWVNESGDTMTGQLIIQSGNGRIISTNAGGAASFQTDAGQAGYISFGNTADIGISTDGVEGDNWDSDGSFIFKQKGSNPDGLGEFVWLEEAGDWRFALPSAGADLGTYNPRSMWIAGASKNNDSNFNRTTWGFDMVDGDTGGTGADLGVQDDVQVGGTIYVDGEQTGGVWVNETANVGQGLTLLSNSSAALSRIEFCQDQQTGSYQCGFVGIRNTKVFFGASGLPGVDTFQLNTGTDNLVFGTNANHNDKKFHLQATNANDIVLGLATAIGHTEQILAFFNNSDDILSWFEASGNLNMGTKNITNTTLSYEVMPFGYEQDWWSNSSIPLGMVWMNGTNLSRTTNAECFSIFSFTYGNNSDDDFLLPDVTGRNVMYQQAGNFSVLGDTGGEVNHTLSVGELASHNHQYNYPATVTRQTGITSSGNPAAATFPNTANTGSGTPHNVLDPYIVAGGRIVRC